MPQLNESVILAAIEGFESQKARIDQQIAELRAMVPLRSTSDGSHAGPQRKRKLSAEALQRIRAGQLRRWAKIRGESTPSTPASTEAPKPKRKLSAAGRRAISQASKRRWALKRAAAAKAQAPAAKKSTPARKKAAVKKAGVQRAPVAKKAAPATPAA